MTFFGKPNPIPAAAHSKPTGLQAWAQYVAENWILFALAAPALLPVNDN